MSNILLFSHSGFSDENANGITMKNLLSAWNSGEKAEFYCDVEPPDFSAADNYFRVTDMQMMSAFAMKRANHIFRAEDMIENEAHISRSDAAKSPSRIPLWLKKRKYNFRLKWLREILWAISPWGHKALERWIDEFAPDVIVYMVGESIFMDRLVLRTVERTAAKLVLYNGEAYRIIDIKTRKGLERAYYRKAEKLYQRLNESSSLAIFNCTPLMDEYSKVYQASSKQIVAYNSATYVCSEYRPNFELVLSYFGNLGVGRVDSLLQIADVLHEIDSSLSLNIYGNAADADKEKMGLRSNIRYHGFVSADVLHDVAEKSDILIHAESFDAAMVHKLRFAFSTKLAQYLCAGRTILCYAPAESTSAKYLKGANGAVVATNPIELRHSLEQLVYDPELRVEYADLAGKLGRKNHNRERTAAFVKLVVDSL